MSLSLNQFDIICLITLLLVGGGSGYLSASASLREKRNITIENEQLSRKQKDIRTALNTLQQLKEAMEATKNEISRLNEKIPAPGKIGSFLKDLDLLMKDQGLALLSVQPQAGLKESLFTRIPIRVNFRGPFDKAFEALSRLETMKRMVRLDGMSMTRLDADHGCQVELTLSIFEQGA